MSLFQFPPQWTPLEIALWAFRLLGVLTFIAYPGVLVAGIMSIAAPSARGSLDLSHILLRIFIFASLIYPLIFFAMYFVGDSLKTISPVMALIFTGLPAVLVYGYFGTQYVTSRAQLRQIQSQNNELREQMISDLKSGDFKIAFSFFENPALHDKIYLLENSDDPGFDFAELINQTVPPTQRNGQLIEQMIRYAGPDLRGVTNVHWSSTRPDGRIQLKNQSVAVLALISDWKTQGVHADLLSEPARWWWDPRGTSERAHDSTRTQRPARRETALLLRKPAPRRPHQLWNFVRQPAPSDEGRCSDSHSEGRKVRSLRKDSRNGRTLKFGALADGALKPGKDCPYGSPSEV